MIEFDLVEEAVANAKAIAWDTCHKIYVLMDDQQVEKMRGYGYDPLITNAEQTPAEMLETVKKWFADSCGLRFVDAVSGEDTFTVLIGQGEGDEEDEDEEEEGEE